MTCLTLLGVSSGFTTDVVQPQSEHLLTHEDGAMCRVMATAHLLAVRCELVDRRAHLGAGGVGIVAVDRQPHAGDPALELVSFQLGAGHDQTIEAVAISALKVPLAVVRAAWSCARLAAPRTDDFVVESIVASGAGQSEGRG